MIRVHAPCGLLFWVTVSGDYRARSEPLLPARILFVRESETVEKLRILRLGQVLFHDYGQVSIVFLSSAYPNRNECQAAVALKPFSLVCFGEGRPAAYLSLLRLPNSLFIPLFDFQTRPQTSIAISAFQLRLHLTNRAWLHLSSDTMLISAYVLCHFRLGYTILKEIEHTNRSMEDKPK